MSDMRDLKTDPILQEDLIEFLNNHSDFSFEIQALNALTNCGFTCEHGGTYCDPSTNKSREFDIRATKRFGNYVIRLAVECKNLRSNFPVLISCLPRRVDEAFHEISYSVNPETNPIEKPPERDILAMRSKSKNIRLTGEYSLYKPGEPVGKSCDQVGKTKQDKITSNDSEVYDKWSQALSSSHDLTYLCCRDGYQTGSFALSIVLPILLVPNGRLWQTQFDADGKRITEPEQVNRCSYFVGRNYYHHSLSGGDQLTLSHLEFLTFDGLAKFIDDLCGDENKIKVAFPVRL